MTIKIKNMVCRHCVDKVKEIVAAIPGLAEATVELGAVVMDEEPSEDALSELSKQLDANGFELILSREAETVESIKRLLISQARREEPSRVSLSDYLSDELHTSYKTLSRIFTEAEGRTIENYYIALRIERVKELLHYGRMTLDEIAYVTGFSSAAHLSRQFKQQTGLTPGQFREMGKRKPLPEV